MLKTLLSMSFRNDMGLWKFFFHKQIKIARVLKLLLLVCWLGFHLYTICVLPASRITWQVKDSQKEMAWSCFYSAFSAWTLSPYLCIFSQKKCVTELAKHKQVLLQKVECAKGKTFFKIIVFGGHLPETRLNYFDSVLINSERKRNTLECWNVF